MASINDILTSIFNASRETGKGIGARSESLMGTTGETKSFEDVLSQMAAEDDVVESPNSSASFGAGVLEPESENVMTGILPKTSPDVSGSLLGSLVSITEIDVRVSETIKTTGSISSNQITQALASLTRGLQNLLQLASQLLSHGPEQAAQALVSLGGPEGNGEGAKELLNSLRVMMEGVPESQNPLLVSQNQQNALLGQWVQQMIQSQQMLFGNLSSQAPLDGSSQFPVSAFGGFANLAPLGGSANSELGLQISFSETNVSEKQTLGGQVSQVFISLQTFQMSATFIQSGYQNSTSQSNSGQVFQPVAIPDLSPLMAWLSLPVISSGVFPGGPEVMPVDESDLRQNFKQLVQLLMNFGVSRAALTSFANRTSDGDGVVINNGAGIREVIAQEIPSQLPGFQVLKVAEPPIDIAEIPNFSAVSSRPLTVDLPSRELSVSSLLPAETTVPDLIQARSTTISASWLNVLEQTFENPGMSNIVSSASSFVIPVLNSPAQNDADQMMAKMSVSSETLVTPAGLGIQSSPTAEGSDLASEPSHFSFVPSSFGSSADLGNLPSARVDSFFVNPSKILLEASEFQPIAQNTPNAVVAGEALKGSISKPEIINQTNLLPPSSNSPSKEIKPILPLAVTAVETLSNPFSLNVSDDQVPKDMFESILQPLTSGTILIGQQFAGETTKAANAQGSGSDNLKLEIPGVWDVVSTQINTHSSELKAFSRLSIQLIPESLGRVTVQIALVDSAISAKIIVATHEVRETLQNHMVDLKASLSQAGLQIDQLQVQVQGGSSNLLAQYFQYQQEGYGNSLPSWSSPESLDSLETLEKIGNSSNLSIRMSLVDVLV